MHFTFRSTIHFELMFMKGVRPVSIIIFRLWTNSTIIIFRPWTNSSLGTICLKHLSPLNCLHSSVKDLLTVFMWFYFWMLFCSTDTLFCFLTNITVLITSLSSHCCLLLRFNQRSSKNSKLVIQSFFCTYLMWLFYKEFLKNVCGSPKM